MAINILIYVNLCKFMQIRQVCGILKSTMTTSTECQPARKHKITLSESASKRPNLCRNDSYIFGQKRFCVEIALCQNCLYRSD